MEAITFGAIFSKATTTVDGGWNLTLSVNPEEADQIVKLFKMKDSLFQVALVPVPREPKIDKQDLLAVTGMGEL